MPSLPTGIVTYLFTDIEGSTRLLQDLGERYADVLATHHRILRLAFTAWGGQEVETHGDGFFVAFPRATDAVAASVAAQRGLVAHAWPEGAVVRVRMGLHTGEPLTAETGYVDINIHRAARICSAGHGGQILLSQATRELVEDELPAGAGLRDLGEHRLKDLARPIRLSQVVVPDLPDAFQPLKSLSSLPNNLPVQLTSFIGRERERAEVKRLLVTARLLTLTGAGGAGKTRLALQVAAEVLEEFDDGAWLVELASLPDPTFVPQTVASILNLREQQGRPILATLRDYLQHMHVLLVLDNCEHVIMACAQIADALLRACANLRILATSRQALGVAGELTFRVPSLSVPDLHRLPPLEGLVKHEAVRLFIERAMFASPTFSMTDQNALAVAQVCHRLDGIPLAIELAAARVKALSVDRIAARLDERFRLLTGGSRTALPRHQTLRGAMDWSYDLLLEKERAFLRRLSVFAGGFTLEAAEAVCRGEEIDEFEMLDLLTHLVDKSLVIADEQGRELRYRLLETVRQYGRDKLVEAGEAAEVQRRHRDFFLAMAEEAEPHWMGVEQVKWLDRLETEHDNLRAALAWSREASEPRHRLAGLRLAGAVGHFWEVRGYLSEGRERLADILSRTEEVGETAERATALFWAGRLALFQGDYQAARSLLEESAALSRRLDNKPILAFAVNSLGPVLLNQGDYAAARALYEEGLAIRRALGDRQGVAGSLSNLGLVARCQGDYARARAILEESLVLFEELSSEEGRAYSLTHLGVATYCEGDVDRAGSLLKESLSLFGKQGNKRLVAECLIILAGVARAQGRPERAARIFGGTQALYDALGATVWNANRALYERDLGATRALLGEEAFQAAWDRGRMMTPEQTIEYALVNDG